MTRPYDAAGAVTFDGVDLYERFGVVATEISVGMPEPLTSYVDVPGRTGGPIDLSESLTGFPLFGRREVSFTLVPVASSPEGWLAMVSRIASLLHNRSGRLALAADPGYTYGCRLEVGTPTLHAAGGTVEVRGTADPYKRLCTRSVTVDAVGGVMLDCESGARPVHPVVSAKVPVTVEWRGERTVVPAGDAYRLNDVLLAEGHNALWLTVHRWATARVGDLAGVSVASLAGTRVAHVAVGDGAYDKGGFAGDGTVTVTWEVEDL